LPRNFEFTVIAGRLKGRKMKSPDLGITRPPLSRLRRAIFDFLTPYLDGANYLDLFSGTGSYLFEAVSRGAAHATGVEAEPKLVDAINNQREKLGVADELECLQGDVFETVPRLSQQQLTYSIIMIAPPQYKRLIDRTLRVFSEYPIHTSDSLILCQHDSSESHLIDFAGFQLKQERKYGNTTFSVLAPR
jgi:16S rRNA (guanine966-N2)-methyltransferase